MYLIQINQAQDAGVHVVGFFYPEGSESPVEFGTPTGFQFLEDKELKSDFAAFVKGNSSA